MKLTLTTDDGVSFSVERDRYDGYEHRQSWKWTIATEGGRHWSASDLRTVEDATASQALETLFGFASACAESFPNGENANLFPTDCAEMLDMIGSDDLAMYGEECDPERANY